MPDVGEDLRSNKNRNKQLATYRYSDKALFSFCRFYEKRLIQIVLFIITGDHSNLIWIFE